MYFMKKLLKNLRAKNGNHMENRFDEYLYI